MVSPVRRSRASHRLYRQARNRRKHDQRKLTSTGQSAQGVHPALDANLERAIHVDHRLGNRDGLVPGLHFQIELVVPIAGLMGAGSRVLFEPTLWRFIRTDALDDSPRLVQRSRGGDDIADLVAARKWTAVQKNKTRGLLLQQVSRSVHHDLETEIVLPRRIFDLIHGEDGM